jgi:hypothetical protein
MGQVTSFRLPQELIDEAEERRRELTGLPSLKLPPELIQQTRISPKRVAEATQSFLEVKPQAAGIGPLSEPAGGATQQPQPPGIASVEGLTKQQREHWEGLQSIAESIRSNPRPSVQEALFLRMYDSGVRAGQIGLEGATHVISGLEKLLNLMDIPAGGVRKGLVKAGLAKSDERFVEQMDKYAKAKLADPHTPTWEKKLLYSWPAAMLQGVGLDLVTDPLNLLLLSPVRKLIGAGVQAVSPAAQSLYEPLRGSTIGEGLGRTFFRDYRPLAGTKGLPKSALVARQEYQRWDDIKFVYRARRQNEEADLIEEVHQIFTDPKVPKELLDDAYFEMARLEEIHHSGLYQTAEEIAEAKKQRLLTLGQQTGLIQRQIEVPKGTPPRPFDIGQLLTAPHQLTPLEAERLSLQDLSNVLKAQQALQKQQKIPKEVFDKTFKHIIESTSKYIIPREIISAGDAGHDIIQKLIPKVQTALAQGGVREVEQGVLQNIRDAYITHYFKRPQDAAKALPKLYDKLRFVNRYNEERGFDSIADIVRAYAAEPYLSFEDAVAVFRGYDGKTPGGKSFAYLRDILEREGLMLETNLAKVLHTRLAVGQRVIRNKHLIEDVAKEWGLPAERLMETAAPSVHGFPGEKLPKTALTITPRPGYSPVSQYVTNITGIDDETKKVFIPQFIGEELQKLTMKNNPIENWIGSSTHPIAKVIRAYDVLQNFHKGQLTAWFPAFHGRNKITNVDQVTLALGIEAWSPRLANDVLGVLFNKEGYITTFGGHKIPYSLLRQEIKELGIISKDIGRLDVIRSTDDRVMEAFAAKWRQIGHMPHRLGAKYIESPDRAWLYLGMRRRGMEPVDAARQVHKFLFDYSDLSDFELSVMTRLFPFYRWTRKNLELQARTLFSRPDAIARRLRLIEASSEGLQERKEEEMYLPGITERSSIRLGKDDKGKVRYLTGIDLPISEVLSIVSNVQKGRVFERELAARLSPEIKVWAEPMLNYNFFFGEPIAEKDKDGYPLYGNAKSFKDIDKFPGFERQGKWLKDFIQFETRLNALGQEYYVGNPKRMTLLYNIPTSRWMGTIANLASVDMNKAEKTLQFLTGLRVRDYDLDAYRARTMMNDIYDIQRGVRKLRREYLYKVPEEGR